MFHLFRVPLVQCLLVLAAVIWFVDQGLPVSLCEENGLFEGLQVGVLFGGVMVCALKARSAEGRYRCLWYAGVLLFLLLAGRELSWGRVFFPVMENGKFPPVSALPYGPIVYPLVGLTMVSIIVLIVRGRIVSYLRSYGVPMTQLVLLLVTGFLALDGEKLHLIPYAHGMMVEEFCELCVYALFVWTLSKMRAS